MQRQSDSCRHLQSTGLDHLKCCSRRCIQLDGHSSLGWWMNRRVEEDMVNVAPNPCVPFYFLSPAIAKPDPGQSLQLKLKVTEAMNRPLWFLRVSFLLWASSGHRNLVLLLPFASFTCLRLWLLCFMTKFCMHWALLAGSLRLLSDVQIDEANYHNSAFLAVVRGTKDVETCGKNNNIHMLRPTAAPSC